MRTRNQQNRRQSTDEHEESTKKKNAPVPDTIDDNETLSNISRGAVGKLLKRVKRGFDGKDVGYLQHCESEAKPEIESKGKSKNTIGKTRGGKNTADPKSSVGEELKVASSNLEAEAVISENFNPGDVGDDDDFDWEDGCIPTLSPTKDNHGDSFKGVSVEFDISPASAKKKPVRRATAEEKEVAELMHKTHLLCLLARGRLMDKACNDPLIQVSLRSLLPTRFLKIAESPKLTASDLSGLVIWFRDNFRVRSSSLADNSCHLALASTLESRYGTPEAVAALSVALFRALGLTSRFVSVLDVISLKPDHEKSESTVEVVSKGERSIFNSSTLMVAEPSCSSLTSPLEVGKSKSQTAVRGAVKQKVNKPRNCGSQSQNHLNTDKSKNTSSDVAVTEPSNDTLKPCLPKSEGLKRKGDVEFQMQMEMALAATKAGSCKNSMTPNGADSPSTSSTLMPSFKRLKKIGTEECQTSASGVSIAIGSQKVGAPLNWAEVFCSGENLTGRWVHIDAVNAIVDGAHRVEEAAAACRKSLRYVVAFAGSGAKDITRRYCSKWHKVAPRRVNSTWWDTVLAPLKELESRATNGGGGTSDGASQVANLNHISRSSLEDMELETRALTEPLPTNQQAYRNHHLYVIERWLKKYEILHPKGPVLGFCSGHPVYPRTCVQTLHTKERWLREALKVKDDELPVKVLQRSLKTSKEEAMEDDEYADGDNERGTVLLYGKWQTEPLCLPRAVNGIVPRNERGQVDVWSEKCLPPGTVHLRFPRLVPIAERLGINFAPAMVGFEFKNGRSYPVYEGIVVCVEFKDAILEVYFEEQERREAEERKRNEVQALSRWYQLLSSIIVRQRLNNCYGDGQSSQPSIDIPSPEDKSSKPAVSTKKKETTAKRKTISVSNIPKENHEHEFVIDDAASNEEGTRVKRCHCGFSVEFEEL